MTLKYRIKKHNFFSAYSICIPQYKILGIWMGIKENGSGVFFSINNKCHCNSTEEARERIKSHITKMKRTDEWNFKSTEIIEYVESENK